MNNKLKFFTVVGAVDYLQQWTDSNNIKDLLAGIKRSFTDGIQTQEIYPRTHDHIDKLLSLKSKLGFLLDVIDEVMDELEEAQPSILDPSNQVLEHFKDERGN